MKRGAILTTLLALCGCGTSPGEPRDRVPGLTAEEEKRLGAYREQVQAQLRNVEATIEILKAVKDPPSMHEALTQLERLGPAAQEVEERGRRLGSPPPELGERLRREFGDRLVDAEKRRHEQIRRINALSGGPEFFEALARLQKTRSR